MTAPNLRAIICIIGLTAAVHVQGGTAIVSVPTDRKIYAGVGYSKDSQQLASQHCYRATEAFTSEQQTTIKLSEAVSSLELERTLGVSVSASGTYEMFSAEAKAEYVRSFKDTNYAISLNYYKYSTIKVAVNIAGPGNKALTKTGKAFYNDGNNRYFGLLCGDNFITSYHKGALLTMGFSIKFTSSSEKTSFEQETGITFGSIASAALKVKSVIESRKLAGLITMHAFQVGGEPSQLSKILSKDNSGNYHILTCSLKAMDNCLRAADGLLDYAINDFTTQFSFEKDIGLTPLGIAFSQYQPIDWIGLIPPVSLVTEDIEQYRFELSNKLREMEYYKQNLYPFLNNAYPGKLEDSFIHNVNLILSKANDNERLLMDSQTGAVACFNIPDICKNIKATIDSKLQNITTSDLSFLKLIKYEFFILYRGLLYNKGYPGSWYVRYNRPNHRFDIFDVNITDDHCEYKIKHYNGKDNWWLETFNGTSTSDGKGYVGTLRNGIHAYNDRKLLKFPSQFYFEAYDTYSYYTYYSN